MTSPACVVSHNFETAHRLLHLGGKCESLHGHSWWAEITVADPVGGWPATGVLVDFAALKGAVRGWIDTNLDHGTMLGWEDPLADVLRQLGCKVFVFGAHGMGPTSDLPWPTVENVAELLRRVTNHLLRTRGDLADHGLYCAEVTVRETHVNAARVVGQARVLP